MLRKVASEAGGEAEGEVLDERRIMADGVCRVEPVVVRGRSAVGGKGAGLSQEHGGAVDAEGFAKLLNAVTDEFMDIQAVDEQ